MKENLIKLNTKYNSRKKYFETPYEFDFLLTDNFLNEILNEYFKYLTINLEEGKNHVSLITRVETIEHEVYTLGNKHILDLNNNNDINNYINTVISKYNEHFHTSQNYDPLYLKKIIFVHSIANKNNYTNFTRKINRSNSLLLDKQISKGIIDKYNIPFNNLYQSWGTIQHISSSQYKITKVYFNKEIDFIYVNIQGSFRSSIITLNILFSNNNTASIVDKMQEDGYIKRVCSDNTGKTDYWYTFNPVVNAPELFVNYNKLPKLFSKDDDGNEKLDQRSNIIKKVLNYDDLRRKIFNLQNEYPNSNIPDFEIPRLKAITLDIETYLTTTIDKKGNTIENHNVLAICFYDGKESFRFYISDFNSINDMLKSCFDLILQRKYNGYTIYIHNGSKFDLVFLMNYLLNREDIKIGEDVIYKNGQFIQIIMSKKFAINENGKTRIITAKYKINDSLLILMNSLAKLGKSFNVETQKDVFPYSFVNENNLNYIGEVPAYKYFEGMITIEQYNNYVLRYNNSWSLKLENLEYCVKDCISLYQIIDQFKTLIDERFKVNIQDCPTLTSVAFKIFKANYYNSYSNPIPSLTKEIFNDLHKAFYGGHVDMYIPEGPSSNGTYQDVLTKYNSLNDKSAENVKKQFDLINHYDVNSLYPSQMNSNKFPTDMICEFIGDITSNAETKSLHEDFVGIYKVHMKAPDIEHPIIPVKIAGTCVFGKGEWIGWYYSEELKNSEKYGYEYQILGGYIFETKDIFNDYITDLYKIKETSSKGSAMYLISKLLMNSLFGRFGLDIFLPTSKFMLNDVFYEKIDNKEIDPINVQTKEFENYMLVTKPNECKDFSNHDGNIAVALAITANSRIRMCEVKNNPLFKLLYTDTDSAFMEGELPASSIDPKKLGYWSLENQYIYCVFLAPKTYACMDIHGKCYSKVKGYSSPVSLEEFEKILSDKGLSNPLSQRKWKRFVTESKLTIETTTYDLIATENKRNLAFSENNRLIGTSNKTIKNVDGENVVED